ncbi:hypothetical protein GCM10020254_50800 [Streptomyces goshikiensis]
MNLSRVTRVSPSVCACATSIRSNGSLWCGGQLPGPDPVFRDDRQRLELRVPGAHGQVLRAVELPRRLLDGDLPGGDGAHVDAPLGRQEVASQFGQVAAQPPQDDVRVEQKAHASAPNASAKPSGSSSKSSEISIWPFSAP